MDPISALEHRQDFIFARLTELQKTLEQLKSRYAVTEVKATKDTSSLKATSAPTVKSSSVAVESPLVSY